MRLFVIYARIDSKNLADSSHELASRQCHFEAAVSFSCTDFGWFNFYWEIQETEGRL